VRTLEELGGGSPGTARCGRKKAYLAVIGEVNDTWEAILIDEQGPSPDEGGFQEVDDKRR
jgi:hypothetical protein